MSSRAIKVQGIDHADTDDESPDVNKIRFMTRLTTGAKGGVLFTSEASPPPAIGLEPGQSEPPSEDGDGVASTPLARTNE